MDFKLGSNRNLYIAREANYDLWLSPLPSIRSNASRSADQRTLLRPVHLHAHVYTLRVQAADGRRFRDIRFANEDADKISFYNYFALFNHATVAYIHEISGILSKKPRNLLNFFLSISRSINITAHVHGIRIF